MHVYVAGVNHSKTPIMIRERLAIARGQMQAALQSLHSYVAQGIILSTCNRTEVYSINNNLEPDELGSIDFLKARANTDNEDLISHIYTYKDEAAIKHLFCVASGLDSMVIGEFEILGQVRQALEEAEQTGLVELPLLNLFREAVRVGRRVRKQTGISLNALSVSSVAVDLAARVVGERLGNCKVLVIGAGEAGKLVAKVARDRGVHQIAVTSRSQERASTLATMLGGRPVTPDNLKDELKLSDIVISCTGAPHLILGLPLVEQTMQSRPGQPLVIIDIAVPRDVDPGVKRIGNVFLYNIDDLTEISGANRKLREDEISKATDIIMEEVEDFSSWWQALAVRPTVAALVQKAEDIRQAQLNMTLKKIRGLSDDEQDSLEAMTKAIIQKLLHGPIEYLKKDASRNNDYTQMVNKLFQLESDEPE